MKRLIASICLTVFATPAHADWQFTKWGMTAKAVSAAANGRAIQTGPDERSDRGGMPLLKMPYHAGGADFEAFFVFDERERLVSVILDPVDMERACLALPPKLKSQYGKPENEGVSAGMLDITWRDKRSKNYVRFSGMSGYCVLSYQPLQQADSKGL